MSNLGRTSSNKSDIKPQKLQKLPKNTKITKRPLLRPNIPSPYSGRQSQKVVYISAKTPFISAVKRVRRLLYLAEKRDLQAKISTSSLTSTAAAHGTTSTTRGGGKVKSAFTAVDALTSANAVGIDIYGKRRPEEVLIKATGKAIAKAMNLALFFQQQKDCAVVVRTGSVHAIDDIEVKRDGLDFELDEEGRDEMDVEDGIEKPRKGKKERNNVGKEHIGTNGAMEVPETRVRQTSVLEVAVTLK